MQPGTLLRQSPHALCAFLFLYQQPFLSSPLLQANEGKFSSQFPAMEAEGNSSSFHPFRQLCEWFIVSLVPDEDFTRSVLALRNHTLEVTVIKRMIFNLDGEALVGRFHKRNFGDGP